MNPFTRALLRQVEDRRLIAWVADWDALEALIVQVSKARAAAPHEEAEYMVLRARLSDGYAVWQPALDSYWRRTKIGGEPADHDPFSSLLAIPNAAGFVNNRRALQTLPAAREAINQYLADLIDTR